MNINVRKLEKEDIEKIIPLRIDLQIHDNGGNLGVEQTDLEERTRIFLEKNINQDLYMFGTFVNDELVSICGFIISRYFPQANDLNGEIAYVTSVYTKEKYRKKGYQRKAFEECINFAKKLGIIRFYLSTKNPNAMKLYASMGFVDNLNAKKMRTDSI